MTIFFTSDLHLGHAKIIELCNRPFSSVEEMNEKIIENWNNEVGNDDLVFVLGDVCMGKLDYSLQLIKRLNGEKFLVPGNHDRVWPGYHRNGVKESDVLRYKDAGFEILEGNVTFLPGKGQKPWKLCHFPTSGDSYTDDRYPEYRPTLEPHEWLIHGHVHNMWTVKGRQINVGVDVWDFTPVHQEVLEKLVALGPVEE